MSPAESKVRTILHTNARTHLGRIAAPAYVVPIRPTSSAAKPVAKLTIDPRAVAARRAERRAP